MPTATTPTVAIARILRGLGLRQGSGKDFRVTGHYSRGERAYTYVILLNPHADQVAAEHADLIEDDATDAGYPFRVSVYRTNNTTWALIHNGPMTRVREALPATEPARVPYDADHVQIAKTSEDHYNALYIPNPADYADPDYVNAYLHDTARYGTVQVIATAFPSVHPHNGRMRRGWTVRQGSNVHHTTNRAEARLALTEAINDHFNALN